MENVEMILCKKFLVYNSKEIRNMPKYSSVTCCRFFFFLLKALKACELSEWLRFFLESELHWIEANMQFRDKVMDLRQTAQWSLYIMDIPYHIANFSLQSNAIFVNYTNILTLFFFLYICTKFQNEWAKSDILLRWCDQCTGEKDDTPIRLAV